MSRDASSETLTWVGLRRPGGDFLRLGDAIGKPVIRVLVLTDLVASTELVEDLGDARAAELAARHDGMARDLLACHGGLEIDKTDGFLLLFERPGDAVAYALAYHQALDQLSRREGVELAARAGVHLGEVFLRENPEDHVARGAKRLEVEGLAKPTAARVMSLAAGRQTLLTQAAFDLARRAAMAGALAEAPLRWLAHGPYSFQGVDEPMAIFEVGAEGFAPLVQPPDRDKVKRTVAFSEELTLGWRPAAGQTVPRRGSWVLTERAGEGGFGEVWLARHKSGEVRVFKFCFEAERLRALKREVTLFRLLKEGLGHRDDIARILDWDFEQPPYFLETEHTDGGNLADWTAAEGGLAAVPLATRLELAAGVAEALAAAHSVGIVHKDVKPENVLVDLSRGNRPRIRLTDFGIGFVADWEKVRTPGVTVAGFTEMAPPESSTGGTVRYMAPELLEGKPATVQTDIYALGVMLYQMVAGDFSRTLASGWPRDVEDEILREDLACFVDGSPERRPRHALEVADRLRRLDERRAERAAEREAREAAERALREAERSRRVRRMLAAVATAAVIVLTVVSVLALQAMKARQEADHRRLEAEGLVDFMLFDLRDGLEDIGRLDLLQKVAAKAQGYLEAQPEATGSDAALRRRGISLLNTADVLLNQGETARAADGYRAAVAIFEGLTARAGADAEDHLNLAASLGKLGEAEQVRGNVADALASFRSALAVAEGLAAQRPEDPETRLALAQARYRIGYGRYRSGQLDAALEGFEAAIAAIAGMDPQEEDTGWRYRKVRLDSQVQIGNVHAQRAELAPALTAYRAALESVEQLVEADPTNLNWRSTHAECQTLIGNLQARGNDFAGAVGAYRAANDLYRSLIKEDPANLKWRRLLGRSLMVKADIHFSANELDEGVSSAQSAREIVEDLIARDPDDSDSKKLLAHIHMCLGDQADARGDAHSALESYLTARSIVTSLGSAEETKQLLLGYLHVLTGHALSRLGRVEEARREWHEALATHQPLLEGKPPGIVLMSQVWALLALGRIEEARPLMERIPSGDLRFEPRLATLLKEKGLARP